jgi:TolA-binding protein
METLRHDIDLLRQQAGQPQSSGRDEEVTRLKGELERLRAEAQAKVGQLQERIKELNQKLMGGAAPRR